MRILVVWTDRLYLEKHTSYARWHALDISISENSENSESKQTRSREKKKRQHREVNENSHLHKH